MTIYVDNKAKAQYNKRNEWRGLIPDMPVLPLITRLLLDNG
jgi:hypothetical protein